MHQYRFEAPSRCCPDQRVLVERTVVGKSSRTSGLYKQYLNLGPALAEFKALVYYFGKQDVYSVKRVGLIGSSGTIGQVAQSVGSYVLPGDLSPLRSPVRSATYAALIPGGVGIGSVRPNRRKTHRCPEGYQFGGRFTDNRLSTCGQQLFDIPSPLGAVIGAVRRIVREAGKIGTTPVVGRTLGGGEYADPLDSRRPQIPRVADRNEKLMEETIARMIAEMGKPKISATRMVRRDGYVLEPVVSTRVLRSIPDNRDMEGATYILTANKLPDLGQDELGLLSNTGIEQLVYVLPGGSTLSLRKTRALTVGERRKLGRTVNSAASIDNTSNPTARLQEVANQTGDGIEYSESFINLKNPHEVIKLKNGRTMERWAYELFGKRQAKLKSEARASSSTEAASRKITSLTEAIEHIANGGALTDISPMILGQALAKANVFKRKRLSASVDRVIAPDSRDYYMYQPKVDFEHLNAVFASDMQQHLGIESPDVSIIGTGDRRPYLIQSVATTYPGLQSSEEKVLSDVDPSSVARLLVADFLSGVENRSPSTIDILEIGDSVIGAPSWNDSNLTALAQIKVRKRTEQLIEEFRALQENGVYGKYLRELKKEQHRKIIDEIRKLIDRARLFNYVHFIQRLSIDGDLSNAEKRHVKIVQTIAEQRVDVLENVLEIIGNTLKAAQ